MHLRLGLGQCSGTRPQGEEDVTSATFLLPNANSDFTAPRDSRFQRPRPCLPRLDRLYVKSYEGLTLQCEESNEKLRDVYQHYIDAAQAMTGPTGQSYGPDKALAAVNELCPAR